MSFEITQKRKFHNLMGYCTDSRNLYTLSALDNYFELATFDGKSFSPISRFVVAYYPYIKVPPFIKGDIIFLPAVDGRIIGLDTHSNELIVDVDLGPTMVASEPQCDNEFIYSVCSIPISNRPTTDTDISVICINDLTSGKKRGQSCVLKGRVSPLFLGRKIWVASEKQLIRFSKQGEQEKAVSLNFSLSSPPVVTDKRVFTFSGFGGIEIFDLELESIARLMTGKNTCFPIQIRNEVFWFAEKILYKLDLDTEKTERLTILPSRTCKGKVSFSNNRIYAATRDGQVVEFDIEQNNATGLAVGDNLRDPVATTNEIFVATDSEIYQLCPTTR